MRSGFVWGLLIGAAAMYAYEHFGPTPKMNAGKYAHG